VSPNALRHCDMGLGLNNMHIPFKLYITNILTYLYPCVILLEESQP
jgi:hypothetical protein